MIWETIEEVRKGTTTAAQANAVTNATGKYLSTVKLEMDYCRITGKQPELQLFHGGKDVEKVKAIK